MQKIKDTTYLCEGPPQASLSPTVVQLLLLYCRCKNSRIFIIAIYYSYYIILGSPKGFDLVSVHDLPLWI